MEEAIKQILKELGATDPEVLLNTPKRASRALNEILSLRASTPPVLTTFQTNSPGEMVFKTGLKATSLCPHHLLVYLLEATFAYVPSTKVVGISKPGRLLQWGAGRLILQEEIGAIFIREFCRVVQPLGTILLLKGYHLCESIRGVQQRDSVTITVASSGCLTEGPKRDEFFKLVQMCRED